jgi:hypothetical protein
MQYSPFRKPRLHVRLVAILALGYVAWLLFVPITVDYTTNDGEVTVSGTRYTWWAKNNNVSILGALDPNSDDIMSMTLLDCGNSFTSGAYEADNQPDGPAACSDVETPRRFLAIGLAVLGVAGLVVAVRVPAERLTREDHEEERRLLGEGPDQAS